MSVRTAVLSFLCCTACQHSEAWQERCERDGTTRACLCESGQFGTAACRGPDDSDPCDCSGAPPAEISRIATGGEHSCALFADGRLACWGNNAHGQLGDGTLTTRLRPTWVKGVSELGAVAPAGTAPFGFTCVLDSRAEVRCFGRNSEGELGNGGTEGSRSPVRALVGEVRALAADTLHACALDAEEALHCWGLNEHGQIGTAGSSGASVPKPTRVGGLTEVVDFELGWQHSCAVQRDGKLLCFGHGARGQSGDPERADHHEPREVPGLGGVVRVTGGFEHSCALLDDGRVFCFGDNRYGQLGDGTEEARGGSVAVHGLPEQTRIVQIAAGYRHTCALDEAGGCHCWGDNGRGQLGDATTKRRSHAQAVAGLGAVSAIAAGGHTTCALLDDGQVYCFGDNRAGQLGDGTRKHRLSPTKVSFRDLHSP